MRGNKETFTPDDMTAKLDLVDPGGWKSLMPSLKCGDAKVVPGKIVWDGCSRNGCCSSTENGCS